jgi:hypothetical protein
MDSELEVDSTTDSTTDHTSDSESDLWERFDFPQLTAEDDAQLTIALQGNTSQTTTAIETTSTATPHEATADCDDYSYIRSGVQGPTNQGASESGLSSSPPPYATDSGESNNSQPVNHYFIINNSSIVPTSSNGQFYIIVDGVVYHAIRQM